jgi:hypothetical protein
MQQAHHGIDVSRWQENSSDRRATVDGAKLRRSEHLSSQIRAGGREKPDFAGGLGGKRDLRLAARTAAQLAFAQAPAVGTGAIPLRESTSGCGAENLNLHEIAKCCGDVGWKQAKTETQTPARHSKRALQGVNEELQLGVGVRADFAIEVDFFVLRGDPFHERRSLASGITAEGE